MRAVATGKVSALVVILDKPKNNEDAERIISAIKMVRGVLNVQVKTSYPIDEMVAENRAHEKWRKRLMDLVEEGACNERE